MGEKDAFVGDCYDVVVERTRGDRFLGLRHEDRPLGIQAVQACDGFGGLDMLAGREGAPAHAIDEQLDPRFCMRRRKPHVICGALVAECRRDRRVHSKSALACKGQA